MRQAELRWQRERPPVEVAAPGRAPRAAGVAKARPPRPIPASDSQGTPRSWSFPTASRISALMASPTARTRSPHSAARTPRRGWRRRRPYPGCRNSRGLDAWARPARPSRLVVYPHVRCPSTAHIGDCSNGTDYNSTSLRPRAPWRPSRTPGRLPRRRRCSPLPDNMAPRPGKGTPRRRPQCLSCALTPGLPGHRHSRRQLTLQPPLGHRSWGTGARAAPAREKGRLRVAQAFQLGPGLGARRSDGQSAPARQSGGRSALLTQQRFRQARTGGALPGVRAQL